jgi:hypothetical protein
MVEIGLVSATGKILTCMLLADTGAGTNKAPFELILLDSDCAALSLWRFAAAAAGFT